MALSANEPMKGPLEGNKQDYEAAASATVYSGGMISLNSSGYGNALVAGEVFLGHSTEKVVNATGANGDKRIRVYRGRYILEVSLASVAITDVGNDVYASDDATVTQTQGSNTPVGKIHRFVKTDTCEVEFHALEGADVMNHQHTTGTDGGPMTSPRIITAICDSNGNEIIETPAKTAAVNHLKAVNAATGNDPRLDAVGSDTNIGLEFRTKGSGGHTFADVDGNELLVLDFVASSVNHLVVGPSATGNAVTLVPDGTDTDCGVTIDAKGSGGVQIGSADSKLGFFGTTVASQNAKLTDTAGGTVTDTNLRSKVNDIIDVLELYGLAAA